MNKSKLFIGGELGTNISYRILDQLNLKVFLEPKVRFYSKELLQQSSIQGVDMMTMMHLGATYTF